MIGPWARWERHVARRRARVHERQATGQHLPTDRYACRDCEHDWPCHDARLALLIGFDGDRVGLMMYLARALEALPDRHPALIVGQIIYWVPRRR
ncbi:hypothetical protein AAH979_14140 [Plantactinospora sp. ZYX-F-223]|uniref:hypothetical protein n=1 Tax=Plantactinospora sp. ZYX-F-223 TaxID=3144103 RepID=UPI0031FD9891